MRRQRHFAWIFAAVVLVAASAKAQDRTVWQTGTDIVEGVSGSIVGTALDVNEARNQLQLASDDDRYGRITVVTDSVSTQYNGFGDVINGKPEIFVGSKGFSNVRTGDRLEVRGVGRGSGIVRADYITLLGRSVPASPTGIGDTRSPSSISTPTIGSTATVYGRVEGIVRQVNASDNRVTIETDRREIFNIRTSSNTPVYYRGDTYQVGNLEVGDRIRVESDGATSSDREIRARTIEVVENVQESGSSRARVSSLTGRVTRIDRTADVARVDTGRGEVRVDMSRAYDATGRRVRAADLQVGDRVEISGNYGLSSDIFAATTVRFAEENVLSGPSPESQPADLGLVTISGTVTESLQNAANLGVRDRTGRIIPLYVSDDFVVRTKSGGYTTADHLNVNDNVLVKAYRDSDGNYIAQTIRVR
ncbi:MAG TPA: DUF5666 domain-containing protein [Thermoanaerobaculia bacterium]|nr:DUF5666 domain-containing protein [Thermoanaerobaculia bacterium]